MMEKTNVDFEALGRMFFAWAVKQGIVVTAGIASHRHEETNTPPQFVTIAELAKRWGCSRGTVYNRLRATGAQVLDFAPRGKRGRKAVSAATVQAIEQRQMKRLA